MNVYTITILRYLYTSKAISEILSKKKQDIKLKADELSKKSISDITLKRYLKILLDNNYINEGTKDGKFKKYYITEKGIELIENSLNKYTK